MTVPRPLGRSNSQSIVSESSGFRSSGTPALRAGEAIRHHPHLHGVLADGLFLPYGTFESFKHIDQAKLTQRFAEQVLAGLHARELITDDVVSQILSQDHTGFSVWLGEPFVDADSKRFVARYIERGPVSLEKLSLSDFAMPLEDHAEVSTKAGRTTLSRTLPLTVKLMSLTLWSSSLFSQRMLQNPTNP